MRTYQLQRCIPHIPSCTLLVHWFSLSGHSSYNPTGFKYTYNSCPRKSKLPTAFMNSPLKKGSSHKAHTYIHRNRIDRILCSHYIFAYDSNSPRFRTPHVRDTVCYYIMVISLRIPTCDALVPQLPFIILTVIVKYSYFIESQPGLKDSIQPSGTDCQ